jgi:hypothetical protein
MWRRLPKILWHVGLLAATAASFFGWLPKDWQSATSWLVDFDVWLLYRGGYPGLFAFFLGLVSGTIILPEALRLWRTQLGLGKAPAPDMTVAQALNYIVNDSRAKLSQPPPPAVSEHGATAGRMVIHKGVEHADALRQLTEQAISGAVILWGQRERVPEMQSPLFDSTIRQIPTEYWEHVSISPFSAWHSNQNAAEAFPSINVTGYRYSGLRVCKAQITAAWHQKCFARRLWERGVLRRPQISAR